MLIITLPLKHSKLCLCNVLCLLIIYGCNASRGHILRNNQERSDITRVAKGYTLTYLGRFASDSVIASEDVGSLENYPAIPKGILPTGYKDSNAFRTNHFIILTAITKHDEAASAWLYSRDWKLIGPVGNIPSTPGQSLFAIWDKYHQRLALLIWTDTSHKRSFDSGLITASPPLYKPLFHLDYGAWADAEWATGKLVIFTTNYANTKREIICIDPIRGAVEKLYQESTTIPGHQNFGSILVSPDNTKIAFDRLAPEYNEGCGIWILDMLSGQCYQVTFSDKSHYCHELLFWKTSKQLEFSAYEGDPSPRYLLNLPKQINKHSPGLESMHPKHEAPE